MRMCKKVWNIEPVDVPKPSLNAKNRIKSDNYLVGLGS
jgi:hypothetical protein